MNKLEKRTLDPKRSSDRIIAFITDFGIQFLLAPHKSSYLKLNIAVFK